MRTPSQRSPSRRSTAKGRTGAGSEARRAAQREEKARARIAQRYKRLEVENQPKGPQFILVLLCLLGAAIVAYGVFGPKIEEQEPEIEGLPPAERQAAIVDDLVDPERLRTEIEELERALYTTGGSLRDIADRVTAEASVLAAGARALPGRHAGALAQGVGEIAANAADDPLTLAELRTLRARWMSLRRSHLKARPWLHSTRPDSNDRAPIAAYSDAALELDRSVRSAADRAASLAEADPMRGPDERTERLAEWARTAEDWRAELTAIRASLPPRPSADASTEVLSAIQALESALGRAQRLAGDQRLILGDPDSAFEPVLGAVDDARDRFARLSLE